MAKSDISSAQGTTTSALQTGQKQAAQNLGPASQGYQNFANTGGISPAQQGLTRQMAQGNVSSLYDAMKQNLERQKAVQGGYSPGFGANMSSLTRQGAAASGQAVNQADLGLQEMIQQGKLQGLGGLTNIGGLYQSQVPSMLGIGAQLAEAKPSWQKEFMDTMGVVGSVAGPFAGAMGGGGLKGALGGFNG